MTVTVYGVLRSRASRNVWLLDEIGMQYRHVPVIQAYRMPHAGYPADMLHTRSPKFLAVNPNGMIPCIKDGRLVLNESLAINLYLARKYGGSLGPRSWSEDGQMVQWTLWAATVAEPHTIQILYHRIGNPKGQKDEAQAFAAIAALRQPSAVLDAHLGKTGFMLGKRFTVADINVAEVIRYARAAPELFTDAPHVDAWLKACHERPAFKAMMAERDKEPA